MKTIRFKQLWKCQNGHKRWAYFTVVSNEYDAEMLMKWGKRYCECPTFNIGEGYKPAGEFSITSKIVRISM